MTEEQIKHMVDRFLSWKLPENFNPDGGIRYVGWELPDMPIGTNLFDAAEAEDMVRHMLEGLPLSPAQCRVREAIRTLDASALREPTLNTALEESKSIIEWLLEGRELDEMDKARIVAWSQLCQKADERAACVHS